VQSDIGAYEKPTGVSHIIHLVVTNLVYGEVWNVFGVYLQSGSSHSKARKSQLLPLWGVVNELLRKDPLAKIAVGGDFNFPPEALSKIVLKYTNGALVMPNCTGSRFSRFPGRGKLSAIDHWLVS
ncbi:hypothetical protein PPACK8108_LOCUS25831, partial [Phakopsora pachyrhizi]